MNEEVSPEFEHFDFEPILAWAEAEVTWCDEFVNGEGLVTKNPEFATWSLYWKYGSISFSFHKEDEQKARMSAALFIYLWTKGVSASIADNCAVSYTVNVNKTLL